MAVWGTLAATAAGAVSATVGVLVGGVVTHRAQDRQWLRDSSWPPTRTCSASTPRSSLVAPSAVAAAIDNFGRALDPFLAAVDRNTFDDPVTEEEFARASLGPAAQHFQELCGRQVRLPEN